MGGANAWLRAWARRARTELAALALAMRRDDVPWFAKAVALCVVAYAFSPIDLIPDVVPVLGYLDDLVLLPLGIMLARRLVPARILAECRAEAERRKVEQPPTRWGAAIVVGAWLLLVAAAAVAWRRWFDG